ncbi:MAG TPA: branched-chain amino acid ABC transporter permease [Solirubrobacterales bacterium]|jgi:branched-chain amino acid transport system permease protein|nr:branched-chain amino acid ABC transporter permease [Solirubrobacterales bacterium]
MTDVAQQLINWLTLGGIYALLALGIAVVFSILGLINFAHGELVTISGYTMVVLVSAGVPWALIIPLSILAAMVAAVAMERVVFRPLRKAPASGLLLASLALSIVIQNIFLLFVGARPKTIGFPEWTNSNFHVGGVVVQWLDVATWVVTALVLFAVIVFLKRSVRGLALRAAAEDFEVTRLMGIRANGVIVGAFAVSGLLAGVAAFFFLATASLVSPETGFIPLLNGFIAAVVGGLGSLSGAVLGGFVLAGLQVFFQLALPDSLLPFTQAITFGFVILVLLVRPNGLMAARSVAVERA